MNQKIIKLLAKKLKVDEKQVEATLSLLSEDSTVPFIARYRKDVTGNLDEEQIEFINVKYKYGIELEKRKEAIVDLLKEKGMWTEQLQEAIMKAETKAEVENIYEPFKSNKKTKATEAIALGLEPLAKSIFENTEKTFNPVREAKKYVNDKVPTVEFAIEQAKYIIAQWISQDLEARSFVKANIEKYGVIHTKKKSKAEDEKKVYEIYYDFTIPVKYVKGYQTLAMNRAEDSKIISYTIDFKKGPILYDLDKKYFKVPTTGKIIHESLEDALDRLIFPSLVREVKSDLFDVAEKNAIELFSNNLEGLLLSPVLKNKRLISIDPGYVSGCKLAIIDENGTFLHKELMYITTSAKNHDSYQRKIAELIGQYKINTIVVGNGTGSKEVKTFVDNFLNKLKTVKIDAFIVSEVGASVYSASKIAIDEFPELNVEERSAINIGRRYQDPLNELVKIDPKSLGVGQYQHDVNQKELKEALDFKISKVVNQVGVEVNTANKAILSHISGITPATADKIVDWIKTNGVFKDRTQIQKVKGLTKKAYEQAIGFLRISDSDYYFDRTFVHPEAYKTANALIKLLNIDLNNIDRKSIEKLDHKDLANQLKSTPSEVEMILEALVEPYRDIRDNRYIPQYDNSIKDIEDIKENEIYEGIIKNITEFGLFVYFGIKKNALVHVSNIPMEFKNSAKLRTEAIVKIQIKGIDLEKERIQALLLEIK